MPYWIVLLLAESSDIISLPVQSGIHSTNACMLGACSLLTLQKLVSSWSRGAPQLEGVSAR